VSSRRSGPANLPSRLRAAFGLSGLACLALCLAAVFALARIDSRVRLLAGGIADEAVPSAEWMRELENVALKVSQFTRTRAESDRLAATAEFTRVLHRIGEMRVALAGGDRGAAMDGLARATIPQLLAWRARFDETADCILRSERSTRGLAAQTSLLGTLCTQLLTDDGAAIAGERAPRHRAVFTAALGALNDIQNSILFASSLLDPAAVDRALARQEALAAALGPLLDATPPSDLHDFIDDVRGRVKDLGDELRNLRSSIAARNDAQAALVTAGNDTLARLEPAVRRVMRDTVDSAGEAGRRLHLAVAVLGLAALVLPAAGIALGRWLTRRVTHITAPLTGRLSASAAATATETRRAEGDSAELAAVTQQQAAAIEQLSGNATEVAAALHRNLENLQTITSHIENANTRAAQGDRRIADLNAAMDDVARSSARIQEVVGSIDEIAFQTNLLALNAAIEAARAGEAGRGFAIVAEEVRRLAQRSSAAAHETAELVTVAQTTTGRGVQASRHVGEDFKTIIADIVQTRTLILQTADASKLQAGEVQSMTTAVGQLERGTVESAERAARFAAFAATLRDHAGEAERDAAGLAQFLGTTAAAPVAADAVAVPSAPAPRPPVAPRYASARSGAVCR